MYKVAHFWVNIPTEIYMQFSATTQKLFLSEFFSFVLCPSTSGCSYSLTFLNSQKQKVIMTYTVSCTDLSNCSVLDSQPGMLQGSN